MSDPLAEVIAMLNLRAVLTKTIEGRETGESGARIRGCHFMASCWKAAVGWKLTSMSRRSCALGILF